MKLLTDEFKLNVAKQFVESVSENANTIYYIGAHRSVPFTNDIDVPAPQNTISETQHTLYDDLIFGKNVTPSDIVHMISNVSWQSGTVYDFFDDLQIDLSTKNFYVVSPESGNYHVFKCLDNNGGVPSTDQPLFSETSAEDELYKTVDGYQWKYMFTVTASQYAKFATTEYIPYFENADVTANAVSGAIDSIVVTDGGSNYNSYAEGNIKEAAVAGNTQLFAIQGERFTDYLVTVDSANGFVEEKVTSLDSDGNISSGVIISIDDNTLRITNTIYDFVAGQDITGLSSNTTATISSTSRLTTGLSANTDFYKNNSFYIKSGPGAGQLRTISEYIVTGEERRVLLNEPLNPLPDSSSVYEIGPNVIISGDGSGARAIAEVNPTANTITSIQMINTGSNYTYADVTIIANTGLIDVGTSLAVSTTSADARAIVAPKGGHGSNVLSELYSNKVGISIDFEESEANTIPTANDYRKISLIKDPLFANAVIEMDSTATNYTAGETVIQDTTLATGLISDRDGNDLRLTNIDGFFEVGYNIVGQTSNNSANTVSIDRDFETFDQRQTYQVEMTYTGPTGSGFILDELITQPGISTLSSDLVRLTIDGSALVYNDGEVITQPDTGAQGTVSNRYGSVIELFNTSGTFVVGNTSVNYIEGSSANTQATVTDVDTSVQANAIGYVHELNEAGANTTVISLTNVKGFIRSSDDLAGVINTIVGQQSGAVAKVNGRDETSNYIVDESGEMIYVEHFSPIERQSDQTERIKLIIEF